MTRTALITGASRGLGAAFAEALAPTHHIVAVARTTGALEDLDDRVKAAGGEATLAPMDISVSEAMDQLAQGIAQRWGGLDLWVHTAIHAAPLTPAGHIQAKDWDKSLSINVTGTQGLITRIEPLLLSGDGGTATFFDDPRGGEKFFGAYGATKAAQIALVRSWQRETERIGPRVVVLEPRPLATALRARFFPGENRDALAAPRDEAARLLALL